MRETEEKGGGEDWEGDNGDGKRNDGGRKCERMVPWRWGGERVERESWKKES